MFLRLDGTFQALCTCQVLLRHCSWVKVLLAVLAHLSAVRPEEAGFRLNFG